MITFTRNSIGTYVDSNGVIQTAAIDAPRFDHDPTTNASLGLLVEESRTNFLTNSEHMDTGWVYQPSTTPPTTTSVKAPDGGLDARLFAINGDRIRQDVTPSTGAVIYTLSVYYKPNTDTTLQLFLFNSGSQANVTFDTTNPSNPTVTSGSGVMVDAGGGWFRASVTLSTATNGGVVESMIYTDDGYLWGAQLEAGSFPTSYIPTSGSTLTRVVDLASISGTNFSSFYNQSEGTYFLNATTVDSGTTDDIIYDGYVTIRDYIGGGIRRRDIPSSLGTFGFNPTQAPVSKVAVAFDSTSANAAFAGVLQTLDTSISNLPNSATSLTIGGTGPSQMNKGHISHLTYWPKRLTDTSLQYLTQ